MEEPSLDDTMPDNERLTWAVRSDELEAGKDSVLCTEKNSGCLRESNFQAQCVVRVTANDVFVIRYACSRKKL